MKKFLFLSVVLMMFIAGSSQTIGNIKGPMTNPNGLTIDTVTNATAEGPTLAVSGSFKQLGVTIEVTKISGTVAGKVYLRGTNRVGATYSINPIDSVILTDASATYRLKEVDPAYLYYKVDIVGTGTLSASYRATLYAKKP